MKSSSVSLPYSALYASPVWTFEGVVGVPIMPEVQREASTAESAKRGGKMENQRC
jgi:hypothetical protein